MLELGLKKLGFSEVYGQSSKENIGSQRVIENNGGLLTDIINESHYFKINL